MPNVTIVAALVAGMLSFLSPCVLPLVPPYLVYLTGTSLERFADAEVAPRARRATIIVALLFVLGFSTVFVLLGAAASWIGQIQAALNAGIAELAGLTGLPIPKGMNPLALLAGAAIILMGLHFLGAFQIPLLMRQKRLEIAKPVGLWGAYLMGLCFALGWTPCIGPILAAILAIAASEATVAKGAGMLAIYSLGLGVPFIVAAFAVKWFASFLARFKKHLHWVEQAMGALLIVTGVAFLFPSLNWITWFSNWLLDAFPALGKIG
jgi:cytochrome c-type biogenesis protein